MKDWVLILGASSGIGKTCAISLAKKGFNIYGVYLRKKQDQIDSIIQEIEQYNVKAVYKKANASNEENRQMIINEILGFKNVKIKLFIHSIAFGALRKMIDSSPDQELNKKNIDMTLDVMCNNLIYWTQNLVHNNLLQQGSHIISMTSSGGRKNWHYYGAVSLAKAGIESASRQLSIELATKGISVNSIQAGVTETPALHKIPGSEKMIENAKSSNPHQRLTSPQDVADVVSLFADYESSWMTGNIIRVDGGEDITN